MRKERGLAPLQPHPSAPCRSLQGPAHGDHVKTGYGPVGWMDVARLAGGRWMVHVGSHHDICLERFRRMGFSSRHIVLPEPGSKRMGWHFSDLHRGNVLGVLAMLHYRSCDSDSDR